MPEEEIMSTVTATKTRTYDMAYIAIFAVLIAICSWISIPMTVPFTLQTFGVFMAVGVLGGKRGSCSVYTADVWRFCSGRCPWWKKRNTFHIGIYSAWSNWSSCICRILRRIWNPSQ